MEPNLDSPLQKLTRDSTLRREALDKAERLGLDFLLLDGWVHRLFRGVQLRDVGLVRERPATTVEVALWGSLR